MSQISQALEDKLRLKKILLLTLKEMRAVHARESIFFNL